MAAKLKHESGNSAPSTGPPARLLAPDLLRGMLAVIMAMDHTAQFLHAWMHGAGRVNEEDGAIVSEWNFDLAWCIRMASHLCPAGFAFLLGMGTVQRFDQRPLPAWHVVRHLFVRASTLVVSSVVFGLLYSAGEIWLLNVVMVALAVDYLLVGLLCLGLQHAEQIMTDWITAVFQLSIKPGDDRRVAHLATSISWHIHNVALAGFTIVSAMWNLWLSPSNGHCPDADIRNSKHKQSGHSWVAKSGIVRFLFHSVITKRVHSIYPPLAWISFVLAGALAARLLLARQWSSWAQARGFFAAAIGFSILFGVTRIYRMGNLSEGCLQTSDQLSVPRANNPYLVSVKSFFYVVKYPPDLAFFCYTMAVNMLLLAAFSVIPEGVASSILPLKALLAFGRSALSFYYGHLLLVVGLCSIIVALFGHTTTYVDAHTWKPELGVDNLWVFWGVWAVVLCIMYKLCHRS